MDGFGRFYVIDIDTIAADDIKILDKNLCGWNISDPNSIQLQWCSFQKSNLFQQYQFFIFIKLKSKK